jgi:translation initiation factor 1
MLACVVMPNDKFAELAKLRDQLPPGKAPVETSSEPPKGPARAVVRLERKQRRGKEVTVIEKLGLSSSQLADWCSKLKQQLGCGGSVEGDAIVVQGDFRKRLPDVLTAMGVRNVTVSG